MPRPIASSLDHPNTRTAWGFQPVMMPSLLICTMASCAESMMALVRRRACWMRWFCTPSRVAMAMSKRLADQEGIFVGITSGATFAGALKVAADAPKGSNILCMLPDTGERYLSTPLFADVPVDMTPDEQSIFDSTPLGKPA